MDSTTPIILKVSIPEYKKVRIETSDGFVYTSDLSFLSSVYCFPKTPAEWSTVSIDNDGLALIWSCRFEVHVDQIISLAALREPSAQANDLRSAG